MRTLLACAAVPVAVVVAQLAPIPQRVAALLSQMTLAEMTAQLAHQESGTVAEIEKQYGSTSLGQVTLQTVLLNKTALDTLTTRNTMQRYMLDNSRLGIPISVSQEGLHSGAPWGTVFPMPVTTACSWNDTLPLLIGQALAVEGRAMGVDNVWSPVVNMWTDDRFGRFQESFSPDPTIVTHMGVALVLGLQGGVQSQDSYLPSLNTTVWATAKHFAGYGGAVGGQNAAPFAFDNRTLFQQYLRPWRAMAALGVRGIMPSHNTVGNVPAHAHRYLIQDVLRGEFGFGNGASVSDCSDVAVLSPLGFGVAENLTVAAAVGVLAGVDLDLVCQLATYDNIPDAVAAGLLLQSDVEEAVTHVLTQKFAAGLFDTPFASPDNLGLLDSPPHRALAREAAAQSIVLLKNDDGVLPLNFAALRERAVASGRISATAAAPPRIAVIGPHSVCVLNSTFDSSAWFNTYGTSYGPPGALRSGPKDCYGRVNMLGSYTLDEGVIAVPLLPDALATAIPGATITVAAGVAIDPVTPTYRADLIPAAVQAAASADVAIVVVGDSLQSCGEWADRDSLVSARGGRGGGSVGVWA